MYSLEFPHNIVIYKHRPKATCTQEGLSLVCDISYIHVESRSKAKGFIRSHLHYYGIYESWHLQAHVLFLRECVYSHMLYRTVQWTVLNTHIFIYTE